MAHLLKYQMRFTHDDFEYFRDVAILATAADYDKQMAFAKAEAYNGEVTVEDIEDPITEPTTEERVTELENTIVSLEDAICEMDEANDERMAAIEDALCEMDMG